MAIILKFSKSVEDLAQENQRYVEENDQRLERERHFTSLLKKMPPRDSCVLCEVKVGQSDVFQHRQLEFFFCPDCQHVQSLNQVPENYPQAAELDFSQIYPPLDPDEFASRRDRIYQPKLDWILDVWKELGNSPSELLSGQWLEIGCGSGAFLSALKAAGAQNVSAFENNQSLREQANQVLGTACVESVAFEGLGQEIIKRQPNCLVAFFVLEHLDQPKILFENLSHLPSGTLFIFSIPTFSFATILESAFESHFARNLDGVLHTQLYTDKSIAKALEIAGYEIKAQWIFGQDSMDLMRLLGKSLEGKYPSNVSNQLSKLLTSLQEPFQQAVDQHYFSDARHILAIKK